MLIRVRGAPLRIVGRQRFAFAGLRITDGILDQHALTTARSVTRDATGGQRALTTITSGGLLRNSEDDEKSGNATHYR